MSLGDAISEDFGLSMTRRRIVIITRAEFHTMARACSASEDTVHYLHFMNWVQDVKGSCWLDYALLLDNGQEKTEVSESLHHMAFVGVQS